MLSRCPITLFRTSTGEKTEDRSARPKLDLSVKTSYAPANPVFAWLFAFLVEGVPVPVGFRSRTCRAEKRQRGR